MEESRHDFAYLAMQYMGMSEEEAYKWADDMVNFIRSSVFQYAKEMGLING